MVRKSGRSTTSSAARSKQKTHSEVDSEESSDTDVEECASAMSERILASLADISDETDSDSESEGQDTLNFVIDKTGEGTGNASSSSQVLSAAVQYQKGHTGDNQDDCSDSEYFDETDEETEKSDLAKLSAHEMDSRNDRLELSSKLDADLDPESVTYIVGDIFARPELKNKKLEDLLLKPTKEDELLKKSVLTSDFEKKTEIKPYEENIRQAKKQRQLARSKTKGSNWYDMKAPEMTEEQRNDLMVLQMRRSLDPKRFYKGPDIKALPKFFEMGTIVESPADFYNSRVPKKQRKATLVDELLDDAEFRKFNKRKYAEIQEVRRRKGQGAHKQARRWKKKKR